MSIDAQRIVDYVNVFNNLWISPLQIVACLLLLWQQMGLATIAGISLMILLIPINAVFTSKFEQKQKNVMKEKDKRIKLFNEILNGIKVLKLYAWETSFVKKIAGFRGKEVKSLKSQAYHQAFMFFFFSSTSFYVCENFNKLFHFYLFPIIFQVGLVTFTMFVLLSPSNILDANKAFVSLALFNFLSMFLIFNF